MRFLSREDSPEILNAHVCDVSIHFLLVVPFPSAKVDAHIHSPRKSLLSFPYPFMILPCAPSLSAPFPTNLSHRFCFGISQSPNLLHLCQNESFTSLLYTSDYKHFLSFYPPGELEKWLAADKRLPQSSSLLSEAETSIHNQIFSLHDQDGSDYRGPTNWYRALVGNISEADEQATIQAGALDRQIKCPVLAIDSAPSPASLPGFMEGSPGAFAKDIRYKKAKTEGHWVQIESRDDVNEWLEEFFGEVGA